MGDRRQQVDGHRHLAADAARRDVPRPPGDEGDARAPFPGRRLPLAERGRRAAVIAVDEPRAVVGEEHHERVLLQAVLLQRGEDLARAPVDLLDGIPVEAAPGRAAEPLAHRQGDVRHRVRDVEEEGPVLVPLDEPERALGVLGGELLHVAMARGSG